VTRIPFLIGGTLGLTLLGVGTALRTVRAPWFDRLLESLAIPPRRSWPR
jgi:hypothetical protein